VPGLDAAACAALHARRFDPARMTLIVGGDLEGIGGDIRSIAESRFGAWARNPTAEAATTPRVRSARDERIVRLFHRPGSVQTEVRVGHVGLARRIPDFHAVSVMSAILGGLFNSRLNRKLREEKGYTYGAGAGFDMRRGAGPFAARCAVNTDVTVPAIQEMIVELEAMRSAPPTRDELHAARDYLVGVFPLRFETPPAVVGALAGLIIQGLPMDELDRYRSAIDAVTAEAVHAAAEQHIHPEGLAVVLVGDADVILPGLEGADIGPITVEREELPGQSA
jgi:predicted Zn-dependent peptidase